MGKRKRQQKQEHVEKSEDRYFLNPSSVSRHLFCSICTDVFTQPQRAPCGHSYCQTCITQWLKTSKTCPIDRKPVKPSELHYDFILENIIGDQMVACPYRSNGCEFINQLQLLTHHKKSCSFNPLNLPEFIKKELKEDKLRKESTKKSPDKSHVDSADEDGDGPLPELHTPPLKLRLFQAGGDKRDMLCTMFSGTRGGSKS